MRKLQFCAGGLAIPGWEAFDMDVDISKPLPFGDECAQFIHCEHGIEHITHQEAWSFLEECHRVLMPGGSIRIAFPDIDKIDSRFLIKPDIGRKYAEVASATKDKRGALRAVIFDHGHKSAWTFDMMHVILCAIGFGRVEQWQAGNSDIRELRGIEQHWRTVGKDINDFETVVAEAKRP